MANASPLADLGQRWANAQRDMDVAALDQLLDADFMAVGPLGFILNQAGGHPHGTRHRHRIHHA